MTTIRLGEFNGVVPRRNPELLGRFSAQTAVNCSLLDGKLSPWADRLNVTAVSAGVKAILNHQSHWFAFQKDVSAIPSPIFGDQVGRLYYSGDGAPKMTDLSMALIGNANKLTTDSVAHAVPHNYLARTAIAGLGLAIGDTVNASVQLQATGGDLVDGKVYVSFYDVANTLLSTASGSLVQGGAEYTLSLLTGAVIPANCTQIAVDTSCAGGTGPTARYCYLTKGAFGINDYPVATLNLGVPAPAQKPLPVKVAVKCGVTGATVQAATISDTVSHALDSGGTEVTCTGSFSFSVSPKANDSGHITVQLLMDGDVADSQAFAVTIHGSATEPGFASKSGNFKLVAGPDTGSHTYELAITWDVDPGAGVTPRAHATGTIAQSAGVDVTLQGWTAATNKNYMDVITDTGGNIWMVTTAAGGTTKTGSHPVWGSPNIGDTITDNNLTWLCIGSWEVGDVISVAGIRGMTGLNKSTTIVEVVGNVVTIKGTTTAAYVGGGTFTKNLQANGGAGNAEDRAYLYTYVSDLDGLLMEGGPSLATGVIEVEPDRVMRITGFPATPAGYGITRVRLYRTVTTSSGIAIYLFVAELTTSDGATPADYFDFALDKELSGELPSQAYVAPPVDMAGMHAAPGGVTVGFHDNEVVLSEPYFPHAYPIEYRQSTRYPLMATIPCGGDSIACLTQGKPAMLTGVHPLDMTMTEVDIILPCVSTDSAVDMGFGAVYATPKGLATISNAGANLITRNLWSEKDWAALNPSSMRAARFNDQYVCFYDATGIGGVQGGFILNPNEPEASLTFLDFYATAVWGDPATGNLFLVVANEIVQWNAGAGKLNFTWRSAETITPKPTNLGVAKVRASAYPVTFKLYADGVLKLTYAVPNANAFRLPAGYMATSHSVQLEGGVTVQEVIASETIGELLMGTSSVAEASRVVG